MERVWRVLCYLQIEDCKGKTLGYNSPVELEDFFFDDDDDRYYYWEPPRRRDQDYPILDYPLFVGTRNDDDDDDNVRKESHDKNNNFLEEEEEENWNVMKADKNDASCNNNEQYLHITKDSQLVEWENKLSQQCEDSSYSDAIEYYYRNMEGFLALARTYLFSSTDALVSLLHQQQQRFGRVPQRFEIENNDNAAAGEPRTYLLDMKRQEIEIRQKRRQVYECSLKVLLRCLVPNEVAIEKILPFCTPKLQQVRIHYICGCDI